MNFEDKISRKSVLSNIEKTVIMVLQNIFVFEEAAILCCCAMWLGNLFYKFKNNVPPSSPGL